MDDEHLFGILENIKSDYISKHIQAADKFIELGYTASILMKQLRKSAIHRRIHSETNKGRIRGKTGDINL